MKCSEIEKNIYLYNELSAHERAETDEHVRTCAACKGIMEQAIILQNVMKSHQAHTALMTNHAQMTRRIMDALDMVAESRNAPRHWFPFAFSMNALRYAMATLSLILVSIFIGEFSIGSDTLMLAEHRPGTPGGQTELNLASFNTAFLESKETDERPFMLLSECLSKCLQVRNGDCEACINKFAKPY